MTSRYDASVKLRTAEDVLEVIANIDGQQIAWELKKLRAIRAWALRQAWEFGELNEGDRVTLHGVRTTGGWSPYAEALADGAVATVIDVDFNTHSNHGRGLWHADVVLDREWACSNYPAGQITRYWHGPASETPDGWREPSAYDREHYPAGRKHHFSIPVKYLRPVLEEPAS